MLGYSADISDLARRILVELFNRPLHIDRDEKLFSKEGDFRFLQLLIRQKISVA
jgi:hypothetical protein